MKATESQDHTPDDTVRGAARTAAMKLRAVLAVVRLAVVSVVAMLGAVLALAPVAGRLGPTGRRVARLPSPRPAVSPPPGALGGWLQRAGEALRR